MPHRIAAPLLALALVACDGGPTQTPAATGAAPSESPTQAGPIRVTTIVRGLEHPWAVAPLPDGGFLVTERPGRLRRISPTGTVSAPLAGVPAVYAEGQGGLLDVVLDPGFAGNRRIWLSYAEPGDGDFAGTAVGFATLGADRIDGFRRVYRQLPKMEGGYHFGSRIAFDRTGHVFISQGERNERATAQKLAMLQGKLVRLRLDGSVPDDNPFALRADARPEIWSLGHRNSQSLAVDPRTGVLWEAEHGPRGGDEINLPRAGRNYGWPIATHGINYSGLAIPEAVGESAPGTEPPHHVWEKSPGLSGMAFYTGRPQSKWNDSLFLGALAGRALIRLTLDGDRITGEERLLEDRQRRIRDVRMGADGNLYVLTDESDGELLRIEPPR
jgi:glucose/arabinose dehydrogenase